MNWKQYLAYYKDNPQGYWFKRKLFGWGWTPVTWQGWVSTAIFLGVVLAIVYRLPTEPTPAELTYELFLPLILASVGLVVVAWRKGESPRWQWGLKQPTQTEDTEHS